MCTVLERLWFRRREEGQGPGPGSASATTSFAAPGDIQQHGAAASFYDTSVNWPAAQWVNMRTGTVWTSMGGPPSAVDMDYVAGLQSSDFDCPVAMDQHEGGPAATWAALDAGGRIGGAPSRRHRCLLCICRLWHALF